MIAVDAMGGDNAPVAAVRGAVDAARSGVSVSLFGDQLCIETALCAYDSAWKQLPVHIVHCSDVISMAAVSARSTIKQHDSSLHRALQAVVDGQADAVVTAGNSGAALVAGMFIYKPVVGLQRPALGKFLPTKRGTVFCLDLGVNADCKPEYLAQFALMGHVYVRIERGILSPRIGLLSNGHEPYKGSIVVKKAYDLLAQMPITFVGNIEARDIFDDYADVIVSDGFTGNILLKTAQGTAKALAYWIEQEGSKTWLRKQFMRFAGRKLLAHLYAKTDYANQAGALLLGLQYPLLIAHGCATQQALTRSIMHAHALVRRNFVPQFNEEISRLLALGDNVHSVHNTAHLQ